MSDPRIESIVGLLRNMRDLSSKLYELLAPEIMSYEMAMADLNRAKEEMKQVEGKKLVIGMEIDEARKTAETIKSVANEKATQIIEASKRESYERLKSIDVLLKSVQEFVTEKDKDRYKTFLSKVEKETSKATA